MRLKRRAAVPETRRQKLRADDLAKPPSTFSYRSSRSEQDRNSGRVLQREESKPERATGFWRFWLQRSGLIILLVAVVASAANVLSLSTSPQVLPLTSGGSTFLRATAVYQSAAAAQLNSSIWNRNKITVNTAAVSQHLLAQFPELSSVSVTVPLLAHRPLVYIQATQPALVLVAGNGSFVIDTSGKALISGATPADLNQPGLPVVDDQSRVDIKANHQALPEADVSFVQTVIAELAAKQIAVSNMTLPAGTSELDAQIAGQPYFVKFNLENNDPRQQAGTFLATINQLRTQNTLPTKYIDVRVDGRAYYQ